MILTVYGDLLTSPARVLVNPVNTVGVMGAGLARTFKRCFPEMFDQYAALCQADEFDIGRLLLWRDPHTWVLNFPTKKHYRAPSRPEYIEQGLQKFVTSYAELGITSASFPALGTGQGGLDWDTTVRPLLEAYLQPLPIMVYVHLDTAEDSEDTSINPRALRLWLNRPRTDVTFSSFWRDLKARLKQNPDFETLEDAPQRFRVIAETRQQRASLKINPIKSSPIFLPESSLRALWAAVKRAGYLLPQQLPDGLAAYGPYLIAMLAALPAIRPVKLALPGESPVMGVQMLPPSLHPDTTQALAASEHEDA